MNENIDISGYKKLIAFLKRQNDACLKLEKWLLAGKVLLTGKV